jgi:acetyl-CoA carboxylase biotin carboxyl carrier protein
MATEVRSPMVGKVVRLLVDVGDEVEEDEPIIMIEALKMEVPVVAPANGKIKEICVKESQEVDDNTVLALIDEK